MRDSGFFPDGSHCVSWSRTLLNDHKTLHHLPVQNALSYPNCIARSLIHLFDCFHFRFDIMFGLSAGAGVSVGAGAGP